MSWLWPLKGGVRKVPTLPEEGAFGAVRRYDTHTGVDLYCAPGTEVVAVEDGEVVSIDPSFTGGMDSPWWNPTKAVLVEGVSGVALYGEIDPCVRVGDKLKVGMVIGRVLTVLKVQKRDKPTTMLHLELYTKGTREACWWYHGEGKPGQLLDPTNFLLEGSMVRVGPYNSA